MHPLDTGRAPSLHGRYPASSLLWTHPTPDHTRSAGYGFPPVVRGTTPACRASQVSRFICRHAPSPLTPESLTAAHIRSFTVSTRLRHFRQLGHSHLCVTRLKRVRLRYGSRLRLPDASCCRITPTPRPVGYMSSGSLHGGLLSFHKTTEYPDAPEARRKHGATKLFL